MRGWQVHVAYMLVLLAANCVWYFAGYASLTEVLVPADALPKTTGVSMAVIASGGLVPDHVHESKMEVFVVVAADEASLLSVRGSDGGEVQLDVGDAVVFYPGVQHGLRNIGPGDVTVMYFGLV
ncbi:uncharacterized protein AMSG_08606 [Thecamonas trahens ATCC 50062]|uniref:Cupin type-2 domain-containing protein n=1 Tax=Thecamonas trahens ATCC 50062 TaxID=461836 RepID=A0A0L0DL22_THETB|nr:hypothetical protein AMSG_08606 [Thecamonas trahens ATCC 50062]KNC52726.1 hypothetical protein AMSG_08606 [Thecamonas trahens ATCC 50062]|eukprot:XP_013755040.1 hypothetical protein AMSG_08606 [Thecamonas trahens ATCC 50062]